MTDASTRLVHNLKVGALIALGVTVVGIVVFTLCVTVIWKNQMAPSLVTMAIVVVVLYYPAVFIFGRRENRRIKRDGPAESTGATS
jgi:hypothetical protein